MRLDILPGGDCWLTKDPDLQRRTSRSSVRMASWQGGQEVLVLVPPIYRGADASVVSGKGWRQAPLTSRISNNTVQLV